jgi:predicted exporter
MALIGTGFDGLTQLAIFASIGLLSTLLLYFLGFC